MAAVWHKRTGANAVCLVFALCVSDRSIPGLRMAASLITHLSGPLYQAHPQSAHLSRSQLPCKARRRLPHRPPPPSPPSRPPMRQLRRVRRDRSVTTCGKSERPRNWQPGVCVCVCVCVCVYVCAYVCVCLCAYVRHAWVPCSVPCNLTWPHPWLAWTSQHDKSAWMHALGAILHAVATVASSCCMLAVLCVCMCVYREADLDKRIRQFKTSDPAGQPLSSDQLAALVAECRAQAERAAVLQAQQAQAQRPQSAKQMLEGTGTPPQGEGSRVLSRQASGSKPLTAQPAQASKAHQPPQQGSVPAAATQQQRPQQQPAGSKPTRASPQSSQSQPATSPLTPTQRAHPHTQGPPVPQQGESRHSSRPATSDTQAPAPVLTLQDTPPKPAKPPSAGRRAGSASAPCAPSLTAESSSTASSAAVSVDSIGLSGAGPVVSGLGSRPSSGGLAKAGRRSSGAITGAATASNP